MALVVEDGTGKADAEVYASVSVADAYFSARGNDAWAALTDAEKEQALRRASDFIKMKFRSFWRGFRVTETQALCWPRFDAEKPDWVSIGYAAFYQTNEIPLEVIEANIELALKAYTQDLQPDVSRLKRRIKVGSIDIEYDPNSPNVTVFRIINDKIAPLLKSAQNGFSSKLVRT